MTDPVLGGMGVGLVWGWWLVMALGPARAHSWRALVVLGLASVGLGTGTYLLAGLPALVAVVVATITASVANLAFRGALRQRRRAGA